MAKETHKRSMNSINDSESDLEAPPKKRGRPPKPKPAPSMTEGALAARTRGRPRKTPAAPKAHQVPVSVSNAVSSPRASDDDFHEPSQEPVAQQSAAGRSSSPSADESSYRPSPKRHDGRQRNSSRFQLTLQESAKPEDGDEDAESLLDDEAEVEEDQEEENEENADGNSKEYATSSLSKSQQMAIKPPRPVEKTGPKKIKILENQPQLPAYTNADVLRPDVDYTDQWSHTDEEELWEKWTVQDQLVLEHTHASEITLWRKVRNIYGICAGDLLPPNHFIDTASNTSVDMNGGEMLLENKNWNGALCLSLGHLITCVAFKDISFLRYAISYVLHLRIPKTHKKPQESELNNRNQQVIEGVVKGLEHNNVRVSNSKKLRDIMDEVLGSVYEPEKNHPHLDFFTELKRGVKRNYKKNDIGLITQDVNCLTQAWNIYAAKSNGQLQTIEKYSQDYKKGKNIKKSKGLGEKEDRMYDFLDEKRNWIMSARRQLAIEGKQGSSFDPQKMPQIQRFYQDFSNRQ